MKRPLNRGLRTPALGIGSMVVCQDAWIRMLCVECGKSLLNGLHLLACSPRRETAGVSVSAAVPASRRCADHSNLGRARRYAVSGKAPTLFVLIRSFVHLAAVESRLMVYSSIPNSVSSLFFPSVISSLFITSPASAQVVPHSFCSQRCSQSFIYCLL